MWSVQLRRVQEAAVLGEASIDGRSVVLKQAKHKGSVVARALVVAGGAHAERIAAESYRSAERKVFTIDPIVVRPETAVDRLGKKLGLNLEVELGDPTVDARCYFETNTPPEIVRELFADPGLRAAVLRGLDLFDAIIVGPPGGAVAGVASRAPGHLSLQDGARVGALGDIAAALPSLSVRPPPGVGARIALAVVGSTALEVGVVGGAAGAQWADGLTGPAVFAPMLLGLVLGLLFSFTVLLLLFRKRANGILPWAVVSVLSLGAIAALTVGAVNQLNQALDDARPTRHVVDVAAYRPHLGKKQSGLLRVKGLPTSLVPPGEGGAAEIDHRVMPRPGCKRIALEVAPGALGYPWVAKRTCVL